MIKNSIIVSNQNNLPPFFFIIGRPRSGTTLLKMLFDAHSSVLVPPECQFIVDLYSKYHKKGYWSVADLKRFAKDVAGVWRFEMWRIPYDLLESTLIKSTGEVSYPELCKQVYLLYNSLYAKTELKLLGDKNPGYSIYTKRLMKLFPEAKFVFITRDYRDNFVSIMDVKFDIPWPSLVAWKWVYYYKRVKREALKHPDQYYFVNYEALTANPLEVIPSICEFLGISFEPTMLEYYEKKEEFTKMYRPGILKNIHSNIINEVNTSRVDVWKKRLTEKQVRILDYVVGDLAEEAGYDRVYKNHSIMTKISSIPGILFAMMIIGATSVIDLFPAKVRENLLSKGPKAVAFFILSIVNPKKLKEIKQKIESNKMQ